MALKFYRQTFSVEGRGRVPASMLRFERAWAGDDETANRMMNGRHGSKIHRFKLERYVSDPTREPSRPYWAEHGFVIIDKETRTEKHPV